MRRRFFSKGIIGEILYTSTNGSIIRPYNTEAFGSKIRSNNYTDLGVITFFGSVDKIGESAFYGSHTLSSIILPNSVIKIEDYAFSECRNLPTIIIPDSVTEIGIGAFFSCEILTSVYCKAITPPVLGGTIVFDSNGSGRKIYVPAGSVDAYKTAEYWSEYADAIVGYDF